MIGAELFEYDCAFDSSRAEYLDECMLCGLEQV